MPSPTSLLRAKSLSKSVLRSALDAEATVAANKEQGAQAAKQERERLVGTAQARVQEHLRVIKCDEDRLVGSDDAIKQASSCLRGLQHARYAHFAATQVCDRRLELRDERPPRAEGGRGRSRAPADAPQEALQAQHHSLAAARQSLLILEERARQVLKDLEGVRGQLSKDAAQRRLAVELDRAWIISLNSIPTSSTSQSPLPPAPAQPSDIDPVASQALSRHVLELEGAVKSLKAESAAEMLRLKEECSKALGRVEELLMRSTYALDDMGKRLKGQAKEVDSTIKHAERSTSSTMKNLQKGDNVGAAKVKALEALINDLRQTRQDLQEDINLKAALLSIDERCRKVTPAMASEKRPGATVAAAAHVLGSTARLLRGGGGGQDAAALKRSSAGWFGARVAPA